MDLSESNERLELENRKLKVAAIGLTRQLRDLDATIAPEFNVTGLGVPNRAETDAAAKRAEILKAGEDDASTTRRDGGRDDASVCASRRSMGDTAHRRTGDRRV